MDESVKRIILTSMFVIIFFSTSYTQESPIKISGLMFGDYYTVAAHHDSTIRNSNGFWFRRIYLTFEHSLNESFSARIRLEMASAGDFSTSAVPLIPFIKDAYMKWKINHNHQLYLGISQPPTLTVVEKVWNYRFLEKTPLDLQRWASSRDFGVAMRGTLFNEHKLNYHVMIANGSGNGSEVNTGKKIMASASMEVFSNIIAEGYFDWNDNDGNSDFFTYQAFLGYNTEKTAVGLQYAHQTRQQFDDDAEKLDLFSGFMRTMFSEKFGAVVRVDRMFTPNSRAESQLYLPFYPDSKSTLFIFALDYFPVKQIHFTPNAEIIVYDKNKEGFQPKTDVIARITFFYKFN
jgi:hypothetical protein